MNGTAGTPTPIFRWSGEYVGFLLDGWMFDPGGRYLGWCEANGAVWAADGKPLGQRVEGHYVLRSLIRSSPVPRTPRVPPVPPTPPRPAPPRLPRAPRPGWADGLDGLGRLPSPDNLAGAWAGPDRELLLERDGVYCWREGTAREERGSWALRGPILELMAAGSEERVRYRIVAYSAEALILRWLTAEGMGLPLLLRRGRGGGGGGTHD